MSRLFKESCEKCIWKCQCNEDYICEDFYHDDYEQNYKEYEIDLHMRYESYLELIEEFEN